MKTDIESTENISEFDELFLKFYSVAALFIASVIIIFQTQTQTEAVEWKVYEASSILSACAFFCLGFIFKKHKLRCSTYIKYLATIMVFLVFFICFLICMHFMESKVIASFLLLAIIIFLFKWSDFTSCDVNNNSPKSGVLILQYNIFVLSGLLCILSYFISDLSEAVILPVGAILVTFRLFPIFEKWLNRTAPAINKNIDLLPENMPAIFFVIIFLGLLLFPWCKRSCDFFHFSFYVGPILDILKGKSLLYDFPSQYGYLSIHFLAFVFKFFTLSFDNFNNLSTLLFVIYYIFAGLIFLKLFKKFVPSAISTLIVILFQTIYSPYCGILYPSTGPIRFGFGLIICFALLHFSTKKAFIIGSFFSGIALYWSIETAIYIVPAWFIVCIIGFLSESKTSKDLLISISKNIGIFIGLCLINLLIIFICEYRSGYGFPLLETIIQYATVYKEGFGALPIPPFGNFYLIVAIMIAGLATVVHIIITKKSTSLFPALTFICVHNIAVFSYFISRSHENNIVNISGLYLVQLIIIMKILLELYQDNIQFMRQCAIAMMLIFCTLFSGRSACNFIGYFRYVLLNPQNENSHSSNEDTIKNVVKTYKLEKHKFIVLSSTVDTEMLVNLSVKSELPLNPGVMARILPNCMDKYIIPAIEKLDINTVLILDPLVEYKISNSDVLEKIQKRFSLVKLGEFPYGYPERMIKIFELKK
ncbi:MAG: hypothetical protein WA705_13590 [Candidatus Ozemobacteraceae bacterium]